MKKIIFAFLSLFFILPAAVACDSYRTGADGVSYGCNKGNNVGGGGIVLLEFPRASKCNKGGFLKCSNFSDMDTHYCTGWSASDFNPSMHEPVSSNSDGTSKNACWQWQCKKNANGDKMVFMPGSQTSCIPATVAAQQTKCDGLATNPPTQAMLNGRCIPICGIDSTTKTQTADTTFVKIGGNLGGGGLNEWSWWTDFYALSDSSSLIFSENFSKKSNPILNRHDGGVNSYSNASMDVV